MSAADVIRAAFAAHRAQDRERAARLLASEFTFTSPEVFFGGRVG
ncbi:hypothetical protein [Frankia gtarii]|nr:hypothetical protein [Frankia gtarii]